METQRGFIRRFTYSTPIYSDPFMQTIFEDNFDEFKRFIDSNKEESGKNAMLLYFVIKEQRFAMFNYLLSLDTFQPDSCDNMGRSMLMNWAGIPSNIQYAKALIDRGASVNWRDKTNFTFLHMAAKEVNIDNVTVSQWVIDKGADINVQTNHEETPLYIACQHGNTDMIHLLLVYSADVTITNDKKVLPIAAPEPWVPIDKQKEVHELLFDYTFDELETVIPLQTVVKAMMADSPLFSKIVDKVSITYNEDDLQYFRDNLRQIRINNLKLFIESYDYLAKQMMESLSLSSTVWKRGVVDDIRTMIDITNTFLFSDYAYCYVHSADVNCATIGFIVTAFLERNMHVNEKEITDIIYLMLSYGLTVNSEDLDIVFKYFGYCELFKILLHMDIQILEDVHPPSVARLYYKPETKIEEVLDNLYPLYLLDYYNHPKLKQIALSHRDLSDWDPGIVAKVQNMSQVPTLVELSRNAARKYILSKYKIRNSRHFYTVIKSLPIGEINQKIIALERKLY